MTSSEVKHIRDLVNAYSRTTKNNDHFRDYGDDIEVTDNIPYYITECRIDSQLDQREVVKHEEPYTGSRLSALTVTSPSQVDRWLFEIGPLSKGRFQDTTDHLTVSGSEHVQTCHTCRGKGKVDCPTCTGKGRRKGYYTCPSCGGSGVRDCSSCGGSGEGTCSSCGGSGQKKVKRTRQKPVEEAYHDSAGVHYRTKYVTEYYDSMEPCPRCNGRGTTPHTCSHCSGTGTVTCKRCKGDKEIPCSTCSATGEVTCGTCKGNKELLHSLRIAQTLERHSDHQLYIVDDFWNEIESLPWREECQTESVFEKVDDRLAHDLYTENESYNDSFNEFLDAHAQLQSQRCHIRFQRAAVTRFHLYHVKYNYKGKAYTGYIFGNTFHPVNSPIIEYAGELIKGAESSLKHRSAVGARRKLKEAQSLNVEGTNDAIQKLLQKVNAHLNVITRLGLTIMFWLVALFSTPFVFQYYDAINPVLPYAKFVNSPDWFGYSYLPVAQCLIFLFFLSISKVFLLETDYSKHDYNHALTYLGVGMGKILLAAIGIFVLLAGVNYLGLGILTSIGMWLLWWVIKIAFFAIVIIFALIAKLF